jgi:hypothetical protein
MMCPALVPAPFLSRGAGAFIRPNADALGVQFNNLERFLSPHLGLVWERFKSNFPNIEEHPPLPPTFETFGTHPQFAGINLQISAGADTPRVFFVNADRTQLLQVQKDRFLHSGGCIKYVRGFNSSPQFARGVARQPLERSGVPRPF